jgi:hypothetical protein
MKYYLISDIAIAENDLPVSSFPNAKELTLEQYNFKLANPNATKSEILAGQLTVHAKTLAELKAEKLNAYLYTLYPFVINGYTDTETGYTLGTTEEDFAKLTMLAVGIQNLPDDREEKFGLKDVGTATLPVLKLKELLTRYYLFCKPVWDSKRDVEDALKLAETPEAVEAVKW